MKTNHWIMSGLLVVFVGSFAATGGALAQQAPRGSGADLVDTTTNPRSNDLDARNLGRILTGPPRSVAKLRWIHRARVCQSGPCPHFGSGTDGKPGATGGKSTGGKKGGKKGTKKADNAGSGMTPEQIRDKLTRDEQRMHAN